jgi:YD repeat-containing protein
MRDEEAREDRIVPKNCKLRRVKYLNNVIEQDHRFIKKKVRASQCFKSFHTAERTLEGINGDLKKQEIYVPDNDLADSWTNVVQEYGYDALNRLINVYDKPFNGTPDFIQAYKYDRWGNRTIDASNILNAPAPQFTASGATNRLSPPAGHTMSYDAAGNLTYDDYTGAGARAYDAENRIVSAQINQTQSAVYVYDSDGRRVKRNTGSGEVWRVYGLGGELLAEYAAGASPATPQEEYGYRSGELLVTATVTGGWGDAPVIHDNPLTPQQTTVQSRHITELRTAIDALRSHLGLPAYSWQTNASVGAPVKADPISEMRTALDQTLGAPSGGYGSGLAQGLLQVEGLRSEPIRLDLGNL